MSAITLFLGAGASKAFGYPATLEFMNIVNNQVKNLPYTDTIEFLNNNRIQIDIEKVLIQLNDFYETLKGIKDSNNFKTSLFFNTSSHIRNVEIPRYYDDVIETLKQINKLVYNTYWEKKSSDFRQPYLELFKKLDSKLDVFTTNYDLLIERVFWEGPELKGKFSDGFQPDMNAYKWNPKSYRKPYKLFKLHGSVDWKKGENGIPWKVPQHDFTTLDDQVLLYPGFKDEPKDEPFKTLHKILENALKNCHYLIVIGFAFRDKYINSIFTKSMQKNDKLKIVIWNPIIPEHPFPEDRVILFQKNFDKLFIDELLSLLKK